LLPSAGGLTGYIGVIGLSEWPRRRWCYAAIVAGAALITLVAGGHMRDEGEQSGGMVCCEACGTAVPAYDVVNYGSIEQGYRVLCTRCFNAEVASALGLERFENVRLQPVVMTDCAGERHEFHFRMRLLGSMAALDAFELTAGAPGGYQFQLLGKPDGLLLGSGVVALAG
jgi:hypothetical protein